MAHYDLKTEQLKEMAPKLRAGDTVTLTGTVYTARDAAHKKIVAAMDAGDKLPFDLDGAAIRLFSGVAEKSWKHCATRVFHSRWFRVLPQLLVALPIRVFHSRIAIMPRAYA